MPSITVHSSLSRCKVDRSFDTFVKLVHIDTLIIRTRPIAPARSLFPFDTTIVNLCIISEQACRSIRREITRELLNATRSLTRTAVVLEIALICGRGHLVWRRRKRKEVDRCELPNVRRSFLLAVALIEFGGQDF